MSDVTHYRAIGLMSGSSLDGLDIACCDFTRHADGTWRFAIPAAMCVAYDDAFIDRLRQARTLSGQDLWQLHTDFGRFSGVAVRNFVQQEKLQDILLIASHGHTVFHVPKSGFTTQIGDGAALAVQAKLPVVCDFRSLDVAKDGQGAPLVPMGDRLLFSAYKFLLNLGGIANLTVKYHDQVAGFDICCANQVLNFYAAQAGVAYDADGAMAARGTLNRPLFDQLNALDYYTKAYPKSLDNSFSRDLVIPLVEASGLSLENKLHTLCEHIAYQISRHIKVTDVMVSDNLLVTGGGALNKHLMRRIAHHVPIPIAPVDQNIINYKEALIFALLGVLRWRQDTNIMASVTGASSDSSSGAIYLP